MNIQTISLREVVMSGRHGTTDAERTQPQRFAVDAILSFDAEPSIGSERLKDTIDYFDVAEVIRRHIENEYRSHTLLETLVSEIADDIGRAFRCIRLEITIQKLDVPFRPKIGNTNHYFSRRVVQMPSMESIRESLVEKGAASVPFLTNEERELLVAEARKLEYIRQPDVAESGIVREDLSSSTVTSESSPFLAIADRIALFLAELARSTGQCVPDFPKANVSLQKYDAGSFGITPHRDEKKYDYAVCLIPLTGKGILATCDDRSGSNKKIIDTTPGNLVMLRAPGYAGMHVRPMHVVSDISEERIVLGVRFAL